MISIHSVCSITLARSVFFFSFVYNSRVAYGADPGKMEQSEQYAYASSQYLG